MSSVTVEEQQKAGLSQWAAIQSISQKLGCTPETHGKTAAILLFLLQNR